MKCAKFYGSYHEHVHHLHVFMFYFHLLCTLVDTFHQYDSIIYPEGPLKPLWSHSSSLAEMNIPTHVSVQQQCLPIYLQQCEDMLQKCNFYDISSLVQDILHILYQLMFPKIYYHNSRHIWPAEDVSQVIKSKSANTTDRL